MSKADFWLSPCSLVLVKEDSIFATYSCPFAFAELEAAPDASPLHVPAFKANSSMLQLRDGVLPVFLLLESWVPACVIHSFI